MQLQHQLGGNIFQGGGKVLQKALWYCFSDGQDSNVQESRDRSESGTAYYDF